MSVIPFAKVYAVSFESVIVSNSVIHDALVAIPEVLSVAGLPSDSNLSIINLTIYVSVKFETDDKIVSAIQNVLDNLTQDKQIDLLKKRIDLGLDDLKAAGIETDTIKVALADAVIKK